MLIQEAAAQPQKFGGTGHRLGSPDDESDLAEAIRLSMGGAPRIEENLSEEDMMEIAIAESLRQASAPLPAPAATSSPEPDADADPSTISKIVVRLPDGSRAERRFLRTATIGSIYGWLEASKLRPASHVLATNFPKQELNNSSATIAEQGLVPSALLALLPKGR